MKKRLSTLLILLLVAVCVILPVTAAAAGSGQIDGNQPSKMQIAAKYDEIVPITKVFSKRPDTTYPYSLGKLHSSALQGTLTYLNYVRYVAKLPALELKEELNTSAQYGAVVNAANGEMSHYPEKPEKMSESFYEKGYAATSTSNLSCCYGYSELDALIVGVQGCMDDEDPSNADVLGHRRWFLNPTLKYIGVGSAVSKVNGWQYSAFKVFDHSGTCDYNYIAWPASGNMPSNLFDYNVPWSVTLNPELYQIPYREDLTITVSGGGNKWTFNKKTAEDSNGTNAYMRVDTVGCGVPNCIIFRPDYSKSWTYSGVYTVQIKGLKDKDGKAVTLKYTVDFFDVEDYKDPIVVIGQPESVKALSGKYVTIPVKAEGDGLKYQWYYKDSGSKKYTADKKNKGSTYKVKMSKKLDGRKVYCKITDKYGNVVTTETVSIKLGVSAKITRQPVSAKADAGSKLKITIKAKGDGLTYKWYYKDKNAKSYKLDKNITGSTYDPTATRSMNGRKVYCKITDQYGNTVKTKTVSITVKNKVYITKQPADVTVASKKTANVTVKASGTGLKYQWYYKSAGSKSFKLDKNNKTSTYKVKMSTKVDGRQVYCVIKDKYGNKVKSDVVTLSQKTSGITATFRTVNEKKTFDGQLQNVCTTYVTASGGSGSYQYKFEVFAAGNKTSPLFGGSYTTGDSFGIRSSHSMDGLELEISIKDGKGKVVQYRLDMTKGTVLSREVKK